MIKINNKNYDKGFVFGKDYYLYIYKRVKNDVYVIKICDPKAGDSIFPFATMNVTLNGEHFNQQVELLKKYGFKLDHRISKIKEMELYSSSLDIKFKITEVYHPIHSGYKFSKGSVYEIKNGILTDDVRTIPSRQDLYHILSVASFYYKIETIPNKCWDNSDFKTGMIVECNTGELSRVLNDTSEGDVVREEAGHLYNYGSAQTYNSERKPKINESYMTKIWLPRNLEEDFKKLELNTDDCMLLWEKTEILV